MSIEKGIIGETLPSGRSVEGAKKSRFDKKWFVYITIFFLALVYLCPVPVYSFETDSTQHILEKNSKLKGKKNVIFMVTDGMGPASLSLARSFRQTRDNLDIGDILEIDKHLIGSSRTRSNSSLVTDSAAGATAFSCALKSYNGAIGVGPDKEPCGTILEALKLDGYLTGLVVTTRITDATPASFGSHVDYRFQEDLIADQQVGNHPLGRTVDLIIGGGRCHFLPHSAEGGCRNDEKDLVSEAKSKGWKYVENREHFDALKEGKNVELPLLALVAESDIPYDIDRNPKEYPSLAEQVKVALTALSEATKDSEKGFFLLIEGSRIDHAGHHNDAAAQVREVLAYDDAFKEVINFIDDSDVETVAISTSDHETGGLVTARQVSPSYPDYLWYPQVLMNASHSGEFLVKKLRSFAAEKGFGVNQVNDNIDSQVLDSFIVEEVVEKDLGIKDHTKEEIETIKKSLHHSELLYVINNMVSFRSQTGWTTQGHSAVDVNIYAYTNSEKINSKLLSRKKNVGLLGNHENIEIGKFLEHITGVNLDRITKMVKGIKHSPSFDFSQSTDETVNNIHMNAIQKPNF
ncbi:Piso0_000663 [Millerozyma farinosa CBS 7064]|uniref:Alkaline phosphatase n=1 Tax=Pichia sorbitophila (strain ATCC MYA-4447 / BCRC 22081 / CBS 7064 / NBRC 10061 / NRRL Y-12695) TaxID=559304 RepID=G8YPQ2_PICSO|nr:Piso0_000663 [Millerozyma farinosa CBS 7064]